MSSANTKPCASWEVIDERLTNTIKSVDKLETRILDKLSFVHEDLTKEIKDIKKSHDLDIKACDNQIEEFYRCSMNNKLETDVKLESVCVKQKILMGAAIFLATSIVAGLIKIIFFG